jgi:hypothetical protein
MPAFRQPARRPVGVLALTGAIVAVSAPAAFAAPALQADAACYRPGETIRFTGDGYTPSGEVRLALTTHTSSGTYVGTARNPTPVDAAGRIDEGFEAPELPEKDDFRAEVLFTASDVARVGAGAPAQDSFATTTIQVTVFDVFLEAPRIDPRGRMTLRAMGYIGSRRLWAHYVHKGRRRARVALGAVRGPCGDLTRRMRQFPMAKVPPGIWDIYVSDSPTLYRNRDGRIAFVRIRLRVPAAQRTIRTPARAGKPANARSAGGATPSTSSARSLRMSASRNTAAPAARRGSGGT